MSMFKKRTDNKVFNGHVYDDIVVNKYALTTKVIKVNENDYVTIKEPIIVDSFKMSKKIQQEAKDADLKSILKRVETTGDISLLNSREVIYGDNSAIPVNTGDAYQLAVDNAAALNSLTKEQADLVKLCQGKTPDEILKIVNDLVNKNKDPEPAGAPVTPESEGK